VGGGDQPDVDPAGPGRADPADLPFLQHPEQSRLGLERQFADLVEEQGASVGGLHQPVAGRGGTGEGPLLVPEQFRLDQGIGNRCTVEADHRRIAAGALVVQGPGDQLLAGPGFPQHQDGRLGGGDLADALEQLSHQVAAADHAGDRIVAGQLGAKHRILADDPVLLLHPLHGQQQLVLVEGAGDEVGGAELHGVHCGPQAGVIGHDDHRDAAGVADQVRSQAALQTQVDEDHPEVVQLQGTGLGQRPCLLDLAGMTLEQRPQAAAAGRVRFDDEHPVHGTSIATDGSSGSAASARTFCFRW
jgi:hypothetical protein